MSIAFKFLLAMSTLILLSLCVKDMCGAVTWEGTYEQAIDRNLKEHKPLMLVFYTDACGYCKKLENETLTDPRIEKILKDFICVHINCDLRPDLKKKYFIRGVPLVLFISANQKRDWLVGYRTPDSFLKDLNDFIQIAKETV
jgi:thioredoxin-related protein